MVKKALQEKLIGWLFFGCLGLLLGSMIPFGHGRAADAAPEPVAVQRNEAGLQRLQDASADADRGPGLQESAYGALPNADRRARTP